MDLHSAITKAAKFCWPGKQRSPLRNLRFIPRSGLSLDQRSKVYANNGQIGVLLNLDVEVPNVSVLGTAMADIAKGVKAIDAVKVSPSGRAVTIEAEGATYELDASDVNAYPALPALPAQWEQTPDWWVIEKLLHAVSKDKQQPHLQCLHFGPQVIEATDRNRVARVFLDLPMRGLVSADTFKQCPKNLDLVQIAFPDELMAWFRFSEDELRLSCLRTGTEYPDIDRVLPMHHDGPAVSVPLAELTAAVKKISTVDKRVSLTFGDGALGVSGTKARSTVDATPMPGDTGAAEVGVESKWLLSALKACSTPRVKLGYTHGQDPLRIESGAFVEGIWPLGGT